MGNCASANEQGKKKKKGGNFDEIESGCAAAGAKSSIDELKREWNQAYAKYSAG